MAAMLRNQGNELFRQKLYLEAILKYTESVDQAGDNLNMALAYGDRSAAHFELGMYCQCVYDISMAFRSNFPQSKSEDLFIRLGNCVAILGLASDNDSSKDSRIAEILRNQGNKLFNSAKYFDALLLYNESICYAEDDLNLALGYANRSAAFLELEYYPQCLRNIKLARQHGYPAEKMSKLDEREMKCLEKLTKVSTEASGQDLEDFLKLSYEPNPKIPFIINALELHQNAKYGRHIVTNRDLKPGDIISIEPMFGFHLASVPSDKTGRYSLCYHCLNGNRLDLIPCSSCNVVMFCNQNCATKAHQFHKAECSIVQKFINGMSYCPPDVRFSIQALSIVDGSYDELEKLYNESLKSPKTFFDFDFSNPKDPEYAKNHLRAILGMHKVTQNAKDDDLGPAYMIMTCAPPFMSKFLKHVTEIMVSSGLNFQPPAFKQKCKSFVFSLPGALMSYSCNPNIYYLRYTNQMCVVVIRPIKKGEQLVNCYTAPFFVANKRDRARDMSIISFSCKCEACENPKKFPLPEDLKCHDPELLEQIIDLRLKLTSAETDHLETIKEIRRMMQYNYKGRPSQEYLVLIDTLTRYVTKYRDLRYQN